MQRYHYGCTSRGRGNWCFYIHVYMDSQTTYTNAILNMWKYHIIEVSCADYATHNYNYTFVCDWIVMQYKRAAFLLVDKISCFYIWWCTVECPCCRNNFGQLHLAFWDKRFIQSLNLSSCMLQWSSLANLIPSHQDLGSIMCEWIWEKGSLRTIRVKQSHGW